MVEQVKYVLYVQNMDRAFAFYKEGLELKEKYLSPYWTELSKGDAIVALHSGGTGEQKITGLSFQVDDIQKVCNKLEEAGGILLNKPEQRPGEPIKLARLKDTEGNVIMITEYSG